MQFIRNSLYVVSLSLLLNLNGCVSRPVGPPTDEERVNAATETEAASLKELDEATMLAFRSLHFDVRDTEYASINCAKSRKILKNVSKLFSEFKVPKENKAKESPLHDLNNDQIKELTTKIRPIMDDWYATISSIKQIGTFLGRGRAYGTAWINGPLNSKEYEIKVKFRNISGSDKWEARFFQNLGFYRKRVPASLTEKSISGLAAAYDLYLFADSGLMDPTLPDAPSEMKDSSTCTLSAIVTKPQ